ncbi:MAG: 50S ribosomal protein L6, partial [Patescibacteria group bacterium]
MSRIGKKEILIPDKVEVTQSGNIVKVKGPLGEAERNFKPDIDIMISDKSVN